MNGSGAAGELDWPNPDHLGWRCTRYIGRHSHTLPGQTGCRYLVHLESRREYGHEVNRAPETRF